MMIGWPSEGDLTQNKTFAASQALTETGHWLTEMT